MGSLGSPLGYSRYSENSLPSFVVTTNDGRQFEEYLEYPKGDPREPMTMDDLENKFNSLAGEKFDAKAKVQIKENIFNCDAMSASEFMNSLNVS